MGIQLKKNAQIGNETRKNTKDVFYEEGVTSRGTQVAGRARRVGAR
jgi:hypothetical protein